MTYRLLRQGGDSIAVPQLVFNTLPRADEASVRVALYILASGSTDPRDIAHALGLKSVRAAEDALRWWAGAGLLEAVRGETDAREAPAPKPLLTIEQINQAALRDPMVSLLTAEVQAALGTALGHSSLQQLVSLYLNEEYPVDMILQCAAHVAAGGKHSVAAVKQELQSWRNEGVESGEDAERHLQRLALREGHWREAAELLHLPVTAFSRADKTKVTAWFEEYHFDLPMVREAVLHAEGKNEVRYLHGILKNWYGRGWRTVSDVRGGGQLAGTNVRVDRAAPSGRDIFKRDPGRVRKLKREG